MSKCEIEVAEFNSAGIQAEAMQLGITHMREIGGVLNGGRDGELDCGTRTGRVSRAH